MRKDVKNKLKFYLENPGYFSILILGDSGTGKSYLINEVIGDDAKRGVYYPFEIGENEESMSKLFEKDVIVIKNIEELSDIQQKLLVKALSTVDGKIGFNEDKKLCRIIFTSSFHVSQLTDGQYRLNIRFWDRISQLVIKLPSFSEDPAEIVNHFKSVWAKMKFNDFNKVPEDGTFLGWLRDNCTNFSGNFRDLDKIAILWHQYRTIEYRGYNQKFKSDIEERIFRMVKSDFEEFTHFPTQKADGTNTFEIEKGKTWDQIESDFRKTFKAWAKINYRSIKEATEALNMPLRKMDKW
jgi:hypothetical protein